MGQLPNVRKGIMSTCAVATGRAGESVLIEKVNDVGVNELLADPSALSCTSKAKKEKRAIRDTRQPAVEPCCHAVILP